MAVQQTSTLGDFNSCRFAYSRRMPPAIASNVTYSQNKKHSGKPQPQSVGIAPVKIVSHQQLFTYKPKRFLIEALCCLVGNFRLERDGSAAMLLHASQDSCYERSTNSQSPMRRIHSQHANITSLELHDRSILKNLFHIHLANDTRNGFCGIVFCYCQNTEIGKAMQKEAVRKDYTETR